MSGAAPERTLYVVPHTHWDREWYEPFETFRGRLVAVVDRVLELLASDPDYTSFTLDGQAIVLRDYLEVRPEREAELRRRIDEGRLHVGPWYVLADEFLVSPEALVRNLSLGTRSCATFGRCLPVAYTPDSFGHVSQLPLLAAGFGLDAIVFERGVGDEGEQLGGEFLWQTADGASEVFTVHLLTTYSAVAAIGHADWEMADRYDPERALRHARVALYGSDGSAATDIGYLPTWLRESLERIDGGAAAYATGDALLLLNGSDHLFPQANLPQVLRELRAHFPELEVRHADLEAYVHHARASARPLQRHRGEFRGGRYHHLLSGVLSARLYLKQANDAAQTRLERYTEPLAALAWTAGARYPQGLLDHAWRTLLQNHPHDSICGCSVDAVHDAMTTRFAAVHHSAAPLERQAEDYLTGPAGQGAVAIFNPHPFPVRRLVDVPLTLPADADLGALRARSSDGRSAQLELRGERHYAPGRSDVQVTDATLTLRAELPPLGFTGYRLEAATGDDAETVAPAPAVRVERRGAGFRIETDLLALEVDAHGRAALGTPADAALHPLELRFEDDADAGDSYDFSPLDAPPVVIDAPFEPPQLIAGGPLRATLRLRYRAELPARLSDDRSAREGRVTLPIDVDLVVEADRPSLGVRVRLDNRAEDHRLRLRIASGRHSDHVWAEGHFELLRRPVRPPEEPAWFQQPQGTNPQRRFVAVLDERGGLALLNRGLPEYEATFGEGGDVELAITLLRCVGWLSRDDLTSRPQGAGPAKPVPGAQCPGEHAFELAVLPLPTVGWHEPLLREADLVSAPPRARATAALAPERSFLRLSPPLVLTAFKRADSREGLIVRIWNPTPDRVDGQLVLDLPVAEAHEVRLDETRLEPLPLDGATLTLTLAPRAVRTVEFTLEPTAPSSRPSAKGVIAAADPA